MNGNTKEYQEKALRLDPEELAALKKLKARHALRQHRAKKQTGTTRTNTNPSHAPASDDNRATLGDATRTTTPQTRTLEDLDISDIHEDDCYEPPAVARMQTLTPAPLAPPDGTSSAHRPDAPALAGSDEPVAIEEKQRQPVAQEPHTHQRTVEYFDMACNAPEELQDMQTVDYFDISCDAAAPEEPQDIPTIDLQYKEREVDGIALRSTFRKTLASYNRLGTLEDKFPDNDAIAAARRDTLTNLMSLGQVAKESNLSEDEQYYPEEPSTRRRRHKRMHRRR